MMGGAGMMGGSGMMGGMGVWMFVIPILALVTVAALLALGIIGIRTLAAQGDEGIADTEADGDPVERLKRRYAEGELTEAEFERALDRELEDDVAVDAEARAAVDTADAATTDRARSR
ncbi:MAG: SHOCT domain-containing protein [Halorubrum sp.]